MAPFVREKKTDAPDNPGQHLSKTLLRASMPPLLREIIDTPYNPGPVL